MTDEPNTEHFNVQTVPTHACPVQSLLAQQGLDIELALSSEEAARRLAAHGANELAAAPATPAWKRLLVQFRELVVLILIAAAVISLVVGEWPDALAILAIVLLNGILGFVQEERAE